MQGGQRLRKLATEKLLMVSILRRRGGGNFSWDRAVETEGTIVFF